MQWQGINYLRCTQTILADEPHLMLYEVKDPQSLPTWPRENSLPNQLRQSVITLCATYKEISCSGRSLVLQGKAVNNNEKKPHTETFIPCAREEMKRNLPWSSSEKFGSVNCLNVKLLAISFRVECFPVKERDEKGKLSRPGLSSQPESSFLFQDWMSWTSASVSQVEKPLLSGVFFRLTSRPALKLSEYSEFLTPLILMFVFQSLTHITAQLRQNRTHHLMRKPTNSTKYFCFSWITVSLLRHNTAGKIKIEEIIRDVT